MFAGLIGLPGFLGGLGSGGLRGMGLWMGLVRMFVVRLLGRNRRLLGFRNPRVVGMGLVLVRDFGCRLLCRFARRLIARIRVTGGRFAADVLAGRHLGPKLRGGDGSARNGVVAASMGTLAMAVAAAIATVAAAMVIIGFVIVARGARVGLDQRLPVGDRDLVIV